MQPGKAKSLHAASSVSALIDAIVQGERDETKTLSTIIDAALRGQLDEALARKFHEFGPEAVALAMLSVSKRIAEQNTQLANFEGQGGDALSSPSPCDLHGGDHVNGDGKEVV